MKKSSVVSATIGFALGSVVTLVATHIITLYERYKFNQKISNMDVPEDDDDNVTEDDLPAYEDDDAFDDIIAALQKRSEDPSPAPSGKIIFEDDDGKEIPAHEVFASRKNTNSLSAKHQKAKNRLLKDIINDLASQPGQAERTQASFDSLHNVSAPPTDDSESEDFGSEYKT